MYPYYLTPCTTRLDPSLAVISLMKGGPGEALEGGAIINSESMTLSGEKLRLYRLLP